MYTGKKAVMIFTVFALFAVSACATYQYEGATTGGAIGGVAGAILDSRNPWRGGVIGAVLGAIAGATITDISVRGAREAATSGNVVEYRTENGRGVYRAEPAGDYYHPSERTKCRKVREKVWEDDRLVKDRVKEVCEGEKVEKKY